MLVIFAIWHALWSTLFFLLYFVAWLGSAPKGVTLAAFAGDFATFFLASAAIAFVVAGAVGVVAWIANSKSAKERGQVERLIDAWVTKLSDR